jgi:hypothetical protein
MIINAVTTSAYTAASLATIAFIAATPAAAARRTVVVKHPPTVSPRDDVSEAWDGRQNVLYSKRYD